MTANHAWMLKGWLIAERAPAEIMEAIESVIGSLSRDRTTETISGSNEALIARHPKPLLDDQHDASQADVSEEEAPDEGEVGATVESATPIPVEEKKPRKKNTMSPENRAAAGERMRAMHAAKKAARGQTDETETEIIPSPTPAKPYQPVSIEKLQTDHNELVGKRNAGQPLTHADWPDIKAMLAKSPDRRKIASDYEVDIDDLNFFITSCQRREQSGNFRAPVLGA